MGVSLESIAEELRRLRDVVENSPRLCRKDILRRYGWSRSTLYRKLKQGFPKPSRGFWKMADLDTWDADLSPIQPLEFVRRPSRK